MTISRRAALALPFLVSAVPGARAQEVWPNRPVRFVVSFTPGGTTDIIARLLGAALTEKWGQSVVIENRPGAGGNIGSEHVARAAPDGYTLLVGSVGPLAVNQSLVKNMPYDTLRDFAPVTLLAGVPNILVVPAASPIRDVAGLVAEAKRRPGALSYGSTGVGTSAHLSGVMLDQMAGTQTLHVPYRGAVALNDLLAGRVDFMFATIPSVMGHIRGGQLRPLAVSSVQRSRSNPDVPSMVELGYRDFDASSWFGMVAPAGTPQPVLDRIVTDVHAVLAQPRIAQTMIEQGADPVGNGPDAFRTFLAHEINRWREIVRIAGALPE
ncbi:MULTISPECIES: Bug family tripartite tricarboxylate transporter substrate binding protein [Roseomonadaceae]|uniref:Tripartite tricarboxylate transporter substrate binding protein n=1 Tax=Falsiroseomonas oleicola TaxID=2801474 RepID=A0ABS6HF23_9PROT|nr:tripartite tricarboxylate transporter substrate binding protein [Roseomonas oleicola]MBU8547299.1 tripartite tricarboxylate transporter substrate binding protein [Roseomonas oleicola]